jgi:hypothetical protein
MLATENLGTVTHHIVYVEVCTSNRFKYIVNKDYWQFTANKECIRMNKMLQC